MTRSQIDSNELLELYKELDQTGNVPDRLYKLVQLAFEEAKHRWNDRYDTGALSASQLQKAMLCALFKVASYTLKRNKNGYVTLLHGVKSASQLKWRLVRFCLQIIGYEMKYALRSMHVFDKWMSKRLSVQEHKTTTKKMREIIEDK